jgi:hypothetical protein
MRHQRVYVAILGGSENLEKEKGGGVVVEGLKTVGEVWRDYQQVWKLGTRKGDRATLTGGYRTRAERESESIRKRFTAMSNVGYRRK